MEYANDMVKRLTLSNSSTRDEMLVEASSPGRTSRAEPRMEWEDKQLAD